MSKKAQITIAPAILKWARETRGFTIEDVAKKIKKSPTLVSNWEAGTTLLSWAQLETLAYKVYKRPLAAFFLPAPPKEPEVKKEFRTVPNTILDALSPKLLFAIREARDKQLSLKEVYSTNPIEKNVYKSISAQLTSGVNDTVNRVKGFLGHDLEKQYSLSNEASAFKYYRNLIESHGIYVFQLPISTKEARGICLTDSEFPVIVVSSKDSYYGKIFTLIHELGHLILGTSDIYSDLDLSNFDEGSKRIEIYCNKFAANFLVPEDDLVDEIENISDLSFGNIRGVSEKFRVSVEVIYRRLADLDYLSKEEYEKYRGKWMDFEFKKKAQTGGPTYPVRVVSQLGINYISAFLQPYYQGRIGIDSLSEYLGVKINNIPKIESKIFEYLGKAA